MYIFIYLSSPRYFIVGDRPSEIAGIRFGVAASEDGVEYVPDNDNYYCNYIFVRFVRHLKTIIRHYSIND